MNITDIPRLCINGAEIDGVTTFKLLGIIISSDLSWDSHVIYILNKVAKRMYRINYLVRSGAPTKYISFCKSMYLRYNRHSVTNRKCSLYVYYSVMFT